MVCPCRGRGGAQIKVLGVLLSAGGSHTRDEGEEGPGPLPSLASPAPAVGCCCCCSTDHLSVLGSELEGAGGAACSGGRSRHPTRGFLNAGAAFLSPQLLPSWASGHSVGGRLVGSPAFLRLSVRVDWGRMRRPPFLWPFESQEQVLALTTETGHSRGHNERPMAQPAKLCLTV